MLLECVINLTNDISTSPIKLHGMRISHLWNTPRQVGFAAVPCYALLSCCVWFCVHIHKAIAQFFCHVSWGKLT